MAVIAYVVRLVPLLFFMGQGLILGTKYRADDL